MRSRRRMRRGRLAFRSCIIIGIIFTRFVVWRCGIMNVNRSWRRILRGWFGDFSFFFCSNKRKTKQKENSPPTFQKPEIKSFSLNGKNALGFAIVWTVCRSLRGKVFISLRLFTLWRKWAFFVGLFGALGFAIVWTVCRSSRGKVFISLRLFALWRRWTFFVGLFVTLGFAFVWFVWGQFWLKDFLFFLFNDYFCRVYGKEL